MPCVMDNETSDNILKLFTSLEQYKLGSYS